jgi:nucleoside 2-deoxyribosyltransferase
VYCAGPLFSEAERAFLDSCAARLRAAGFECFLPHEEALGASGVTADRIFSVDFEGLAASHALLAWLDGPLVDDGTACEIGVFLGLMQQAGFPRKGIVGLVTDLRLQRRRAAVEEAGLNLFVAGAIRRAGRICWSFEEALAQLRAWKRELDGA